jgi:hypothetical protein
MDDQGGAHFLPYYDLTVLKLKTAITQLSNSSLVAIYLTVMK